MRRLGQRHHTDGRRAPPRLAPSASTRLASPTNAATHGVAGSGVQLGGRRLLHDAPVVHHRDLVAEHERLLLVVGDEHRRDLEVGQQAMHLDPHLHAQRDVEVRERLVEQEHRRAAGRATGPAPPVAAGRPTACPASRSPIPARPTSSSAVSTRAALPLRSRQAVGDVARRPSGAGTAPSPGTPCRPGGARAAPTVSVRP